MVWPTLGSRTAKDQIGEHCKLPQWGLGRSSAAKRYLVHFWLKIDSGESNLKTHLRKLFVFSTRYKSDIRNFHPLVTSLWDKWRMLRLHLFTPNLQYSSTEILNAQSASSSRPMSLYVPDSDSLSSLSGTSFIGSIDSPLSSSITPSLLHSRLKTFLFCKSFPL